MTSNQAGIPTKRALLDALDISGGELGRLLGITRAAVAQWPKDEPIAEGHWLKLKHVVRPAGIEKFEAAA